MCSFLVAQDWIRKMNINNLDDTTSRWKTHYPGSVILCSQDDGAVDAIVIGRFASGNLDTSVSNRGYAPGYRLNINLDANAIATVQKILNSGLFDFASAIYSPLKKRHRDLLRKIQGPATRGGRGKGGKGEGQVSRTKMRRRGS